MNRIKDLLKWQCIIINELAEKMGLNRVTLSTQINGTVNVASYEKIAIHGRSIYPLQRHQRRHTDATGTY